MIYVIILLFFILLMVSKLSGLNANGKLAICLFVLWCLATFRTVTVGNDTMTYYRIFEAANSPNFIKIYSWRYEYGYLLLNVLIRKFTDNFTVFLGIVNTFIYSTYYKYIKSHSQDTVFSCILFLCLGFWGQTVNVIRLEIALCICLWADVIRQKAQKKRTLFVVFFLIVIASLFQRIAFIYLLCFVLPKKIDIKRNCILLIIMLMASYFSETIISFVAKVIPYFQVYLNNSTYKVGEVKGAIIVSIIIQLLVIWFCYYTYRQNEVYRYDEKKSVKEILAYGTNKIYMALLISIVSIQFNLLDRCSDFFWVSVIVTLPEMIYLYKDRDNNNRFILRGIVIAVAIAYFVVIMIYKPEWNQIYPYHSIFSIK